MHAEHVDAAVIGAGEMPQPCKLEETHQTCLPSICLAKLAQPNSDHELFASWLVDAGVHGRCMQLFVHARHACLQPDILCCLVNSGVVGLAVAKNLAERGQKVLVLESASAIGTESSSRNSEVIHSGMPRLISQLAQSNLKASKCAVGLALCLPSGCGKSSPVQLAEWE